MREPKVIVGFETPSGCGRHHNTHIVRLTLCELRQEVGTRMESILDSTDNSGLLKGLWDAIDFCQCDGFWVSDEDDDIQLHSDVVPGLADERPVSVLFRWLETQRVNNAKPDSNDGCTARATASRGRANHDNNCGD